jgi:hypothetical protein
MRMAAIRRQILASGTLSMDYDDALSPVMEPRWKSKAKM